MTFEEKLSAQLPKLYRLVIFVLVFYVNFQLLNLSLLRATKDVGYKWSIGFGFSLLFLSLFALALFLSQELSKRFIRDLGLGYASYIVIAYGIRMSQNINNEGFNPWHLLKNGFFQWNAFGALGCLILLSLVWRSFLQKYYAKNELFLALKDHARWPTGLFHLLMATMMINDSSYRDFLSPSLAASLAAGEMAAYHLNIILNVLWSLLFFTLMSYLLAKAWQELRLQRRGFSLAIATSFILALVTNYALQLGVRKPEMLLGQYLVVGATSFQISILFLLALLVYLLINRYLLATFFLVGLATTLSLVNMIKEAMRSEPLLLTDFIWLGRLSLVLDSVSPGLIWLVLLALVFLVFLYNLCHRHWFSPRLLSFKQRLLGLLVVILSFFFLLFVNDESVKKLRFNLPNLSRLERSMAIDWLGFSTNARYKSLMYVWSKQLTQSIMTKPDNYRAQAIEELVNKYTKLATRINQERSTRIEDQTVIYILSESLANPNRLPGVNLSQEVLPNLEQIQETTTSGLMLVDSYGGGTANTEFQVLTGLPSYNFSSSVSIFYTEVVPKMKTFPAISDQFQADNRVVLHPASINNYSRNYIYNRLGFKTQVFSEGISDQFSQAQRLGASVSDQSVYDEILRRLDPQSNQFFSVITMQNHAPWSVGQPDEVTAKGKGFSSAANSNFTEYARLLTHSDQALAEFIDQLAQIDKPITVVFYGDHLPGFYPESVFAKEPTLQYQTDYVIWSNYQDQKLDYPLVRSSDLTAELLAHTNAKVSPYYALLTKLLEAENSKNLLQVNDQEEEFREDLKLLQYDMTLGKNYISQYRQFFDTVE
ncbi:LTA synthase family protein [Streptococcus cuniculipharyngis]|uniref:LTA synthase family protein n=1 Tax=Streptococcus cuniculipharyngis TaxID=1562651 RepID=A0A5C5SDC1_9STRE|nr:LTA synthase family protein [Streptococcus cuniculipharyngis]TWS98956.1 LTA synthase family protein [Streptococcus cuniculipharyngis]